MKRKPKTIVVNVTAKDIRCGEHGMCSKCPVAFALSRAMNEPCGAGALRSWWKYSDGLTKDLPAAALRFIQRFDARLPVMPFEFKVTV